MADFQNILDDTSYLGVPGLFGKNLSSVKGSDDAIQIIQEEVGDALSGAEIQKFWDEIKSDPINFNIPLDIQLERFIGNLAAEIVPDTPEELENLERLLGIEYVKPNKKSKIGASFKGTFDIVEKENANVYMPTAENCYLKCLVKLVELLKPEQLSDFKAELVTVVASANINKNGETINKLSGTTNPLLKKFGLPVPQMYDVYVDKKTEKVQAKSRCMSGRESKYQGSKYLGIGLIYISECECHAILLKNTKSNKFIIEKSDIVIESVLSPDLRKGLGNNHDLLLEKEFSDGTFMESKKWISRGFDKCIKSIEQNKFVVLYDFETGGKKYEVKNEKSGNVRKVKEMHIYAAGYCILDLGRMYTTDDDIDDRVIYYNQLFNVTNAKSMDELSADSDNEILHRMLDDISEQLLELKISTAQLFAHNGNKFDSLFFKDMRGVEFDGNIIKKGSSVKSLTIKYKLREHSITIKLKDTLPFTLQSLAALTSGNKQYVKKKFDIAHYDSFADAKATADMLSYLEYDVKSMAEMFYRFEFGFRNIFGVTMTGFLGLPGFSEHICRNTCFNAAGMKVSNSNVFTAFIKNSYMGGRVIQFKREYDIFDDYIRETMPATDVAAKRAEMLAGKTEAEIESMIDQLIAKGFGLISLDMNSLYPSAMNLVEMPVGEAVYIADNTAIEKILRKYKRSIVEVDVKLPNWRYSIFPYRCGSEDVGTGLKYPSNQTVRGVYTDIDLAEMIKDGAIVSKVYQGVGWIRASRVFEIIETIYKIREECTAKNDEIGSYICKIILNALYGKFAEMIREKFVIRNSGGGHNNKGTTTTKVEELAGGQEIHKIQYKHSTINKPLQVAAFVTAASRAIVNDLIREVGIENVYYTDTDSVYIRKYILKQKGIPEKLNGLGGYKNDYGDKSVIYEAIFLDLKRYYLGIRDASKTYYKAKFQGINFKTSSSIKTDFLSPEVGKCISNLTTAEQMRFLKNDVYGHLLRNYRDTNTAVLAMAMTFKKNKYSRVYIDESSIKFTINPDSRANWVNGEYYALGYDNSKPERKISSIDRFRSTFGGYASSKFTIGLSGKQTEEEGTYNGRVMRIRDNWDTVPDSNYPTGGICGLYSYQLLNYEGGNEFAVRIGENITSNFYYSKNGLFQIFDDCVYKLGDSILPTEMIFRSSKLPTICPKTETEVIGLKDLACQEDKDLKRAGYQTSSCQYRMSAEPTEGSKLIYTTEGKRYINNYEQGKIFVVNKTDKNTTAALMQTNPILNKCKPILFTKGYKAAYGRDGYAQISISDIKCLERHRGLSDSQNCNSYKSIYGLSKVIEQLGYNTFLDKAAHKELIDCHEAIIDFIISCNAVNSCSDQASANIKRNKWEVKNKCKYLLFLVRKCIESIKFNFRAHKDTEKFIAKYTDRIIFNHEYYENLIGHDYLAELGQFRAVDGKYEHYPENLTDEERIIVGDLRLIHSIHFKEWYHNVEKQDIIAKYGKNKLSEIVLKTAGGEVTVLGDSAYYTGCDEWKYGREKSDEVFRVFRTEIVTRLGSAFDFKKSEMREKSKFNSKTRALEYFAGVNGTKLYLAEDPIYHETLKRFRNKNYTKVILTRGSESYSAFVKDIEKVQDEMDAWIRLNWKGIIKSKELNKWLDAGHVDIQVTNTKYSYRVAKALL